MEYVKYLGYVMGREGKRNPREEWVGGWMDEVRSTMIRKDLIEVEAEDREFWRSKIYLD